MDAGNFSPQDIYEMVRHGEQVSRAVSPTMTYVFRRFERNEEETGRSLFGRSSSSGNKPRNKFASDYEKFARAAEDKAYIYAENMIKLGKIPDTQEAYTRTAINQWNKTRGKWLENHAKEYGYEYHEYRRK